MIPLLTLGIPSSGTTAILMGAFIMYNVQPGPLLFQDHPQLAWGVIASMFVGNLMLLILNMPLVKVFAKVIETPAKYLIPLIIVFSVFGVYAVQYSTFDLMLDYGLRSCWIFPIEERLPFSATRTRSYSGSNDGKQYAKSTYHFEWRFHDLPAKTCFPRLSYYRFHFGSTIPLILKMRGKNVLVNEEA